MQRVSGARLAANSGACRQSHMDAIEDFVMANPIVFVMNIDETAVGAKAMIDAIAVRAVFLSVRAVVS